MCILLTVACKRRSATARGWKVKKAMFGRFLLFSASMFSQSLANFVKGRKLQKPTKRWKAELGKLRIEDEELRTIQTPISANSAFSVVPVG